MAATIREPAGTARRNVSQSMRLLRRPVTAVLLLFVPVSLLGGGTSTAGRLVAVAVAAVLVAATAMMGLAGSVRLRSVHRSPVLPVVTLAGLLLVSYLLPTVHGAVVPWPERHRVLDLLSVLRGLTPAQLSRLTDLVGLLAGLAVLVVTVLSPPRPRHVARVVVMSGAVAAVYVLLRGPYVEDRLEGLGCNANYLGLVLAFPLVAAIGLIRHARTARWLAPAALCFVAMLATQSRGAFMAAAAGTAFVLVQGHPPRRKVPLVLLLLLPLVALIVADRQAFTGLGTAGRVGTDLEASNDLRLRVARLAVNVVMEHPLRGIGYWMFPTYAQGSPGFGVYLMTHNDYLRLAAESGLPALLAFVVLLGQGLCRRPSGDAAVLRAVVVTYAVGLLFTNPLANLVISAPFWVALGCLLSPKAAAHPRCSSSP